MKIEKAFNNAFSTLRIRKWDTLYIAIDLHDTICKSTYKDDTVMHYFDEAIYCLQTLSKIDTFKLILYTSTPREKIDKYIERFEKIGIHFDFINSNPDVENTEYGDFTIKPYFNILFDDKAGFNPKKDWLKLKKYLTNYLK